MSIDDKHHLDQHKAGSMISEPTRRYLASDKAKACRARYLATDKGKRMLIGVKHRRTEKHRQDEYVHPEKYADRILQGINENDFREYPKM